MSAPAFTATGTAMPRPLLLVAFALSGAAALSYEVVWTRALSTVLGSTTYAVSAMLATFMLGLAIGGVTGGRLADRAPDPLRWFGAAELAIGALAIVSHVAIEALPSLYLPLYRALHLSSAGFFVVQLGLCALVMLAPTILMGMTFPLVARAVASRLEEVGGAVGAAYGANTLGSVAGSLATGFVVIPALGLRGATLAAAALNAAVAAVVLLRGGTRRRRALLLLALAYVPLAAAVFRGERPWTLLNFYSAHRYLEGPGFAESDAMDRATLRKLYERDDVDGYVAAFRTLDGQLLVQVGGKIEGTTTDDLPNTLLLAYLPLAATEAPRRVLVVGLGAGATLGAAKRAAAEVEVVEINGSVVEVVARHGPPGLLDGVSLHRDDARTLLARSDDRFDVITSEPSYPTEFAVANLFSREFYALAARRLERGGTYCQWLPYYMLTNDDVTMMVKTFASVFPHASLWKVPGSMDLLLLGRAEPFTRAPEEILERVRALNGGRAIDVVLSRGPEEVARIAAQPEVPVNTDDAPLLEFRISRNFRIGTLGILER